MVRIVACDVNGLGSSPTGAHLIFSFTLTTLVQRTLVSMAGPVVQVVAHRGRELRKRYETGSNPAGPGLNALVGVQNPHLSTTFPSSPVPPSDTEG